ncbi:MAG: type I phosphomannose isomerase catalytic subunit [Chthoniobacterales bacterium]
MRECLTFEPLYMQRVWGGRALESAFGRPLPAASPIGESWELVDREDAQSIINFGSWRGITLHDLWTKHRLEIFGEGFGEPRFPLLVKILDAGEALSLQVHPPISVAGRFSGEPKTEVWYFVATKPGAGVYAGVRRGTTKADFQSALATGAVTRLLHRLETFPDTFLFIPSGRLHAIDAGNVLFEIQQNSDTTYRVFDWDRPGLDGKPRQLHIDESLESIDFDDFEPRLNSISGEKIVQCEHFQVDRWTLQEARRANEKPRFAVFQCLSGEVMFGNREFRPGDLFLVPASAHEGDVKPLGATSVVLRTTV